MMSSTTSTSLYTSPSFSSFNEETPLLSDTDDQHASASQKHVSPPDSQNDDGEDHHEALAAKEERQFQLRNRKRLYQVIPAIAIGSFLAAADQTIVVSSHSKIGSELGALDKTSWLATGYLLTLSSFQTFYGKLSDIYGRRTLFLFAYISFGLGCLFCGLAQTMTQLIVARVIVGIGGGGFITLPVVVISDLVPLRRRGTWQALRNLTFAIGLGTGSMGGVITDQLGWRWTFLIQVPIVVIGLLNMIFLYDDDMVKKEGWLKAFKRVDVPGACLIIIAVSTLLFALDSDSHRSWSSPSTIGCLCASAVSFLLFAFVENKLAIEPFIPSRVILNRTAGACITCNFLIYGWWLSILFYLPLLWEVGEAASGTTIALRLFPAILAGAVASLIAGLAMQNTGRYYWLVVASHVGMIAGIVPIMLCDGWILRSGVWIVVGSAVASFFLNIGATTTLVALQANTNHEDQATAIACLSLFQSLGSEIGLACCAAILQDTVRSELWRRLTGRWPEVEDLVQEITEGLGDIQRFPEALQIAIKASYEVAIGWTFVLCLSLSVVGFFACLIIQERSLGTRKQRSASVASRPA